MNLRDAENEWLLLQAGDRPQAVGEFARAVASAYLESFFRQEQLRPGHIGLLCRMAAHPSPEVSRSAVQALYGLVVEGLCDDFTDSGVQACNIVLLQILSFVCEQPQGRSFASLLARFGVGHPAALLPRYQKIRRRVPLAFEKRLRVQKAVILSRVSAGADVAITSILVQRLREVLGQAELILIGPRHLEDFFAAVPGLRWRQVEYERQGSLFSRLGGWPRVVELIIAESGGLEEGGLLVFDPDTRLSQLGLLPLTDESSACYFSSRTEPAREVEEVSLPALTNSWLNQLLAESGSCLPGLFLAPEKVLAARAFVSRLRRAGAARVLVLNLGVGGNQRKRISGRFEAALITALLKSAANTVILLDTGGDPEEKERVGRLLAAMEGHGVSFDFVTDEELAGKDVRLAHGVVGFRGGLGALGGLVAMADGFCGYDSCGQHLASALGTPAVVIFAGAPNPRFLARWRSPAPTTITMVVEEAPRSQAEQEKLLEQVVANLHRIMN